MCTHPSTHTRARNYVGKCKHVQIPTFYGRIRCQSSATVGQVAVQVNGPSTVKALPGDTHKVPLPVVGTDVCDALVAVHIQHKTAVRYKKYIYDICKGININL